MNYQNLSVQELLSTLINKGHANTLIQKFGSLRSIAKASFDEFAEAGLNKAEIDHIRAAFFICRNHPEPAKIITSDRKFYATLVTSVGEIDHHTTEYFP